MRVIKYLPASLVLLFTLFAQISLLAQGNCSFRQGDVIHAGDRPVSVVAADFDQDGHEDFATLNADNLDFVFLFLNDGTGCFTGFLVDSPGQTFNLSLVAEDIDGDSDVDLTLVSFTQIFFYYNLGAGKFSRANSAQIPNGFITALKYRDIDNDGDNDMIFLDLVFDEIVVLTNDGGGKFSVSQVISDLADGENFELGDFDGDNDIDLALTLDDLDSNTDDLVQLYSNDGKGGFSPTDSICIPTGSSGVATGDLDGDSDLDLVVTYRFDDTALVLSNEGEGRFEKIDFLITGDEPNSLQLVDIDGDQDLDVVNTNLSKDPFEQPSISLFLNSGDAKFSFPICVPTAPQPGPFAVADWDGDGAEDLITVHRLENILQLYHTDCDVLLGDMNQDNSLDLLDVEAFVGALSNNSFQVEADINQDCSINLLDVALFVELLNGNELLRFCRPNGFD
ncbi:MAG: VCBS repeat-containing protein [Planctomycetota bacterium]